ncbi:MAG: 3-phosphoshikimate 1-carboxyvinyltransferase [Flavobacteriales bacterium]|nr:3-phosphoshikimate 1-carboxyvinyltransferase [Flavobacteriales bacterium]MCB9167520.1 3-phosphoshikimate 1-carboxyvinyltransferase [Flavobacteriales bacterium]
MLAITAPSRPVHVRIDLPGSKSVANRAILCASLAGTPEVVSGVPGADDTRRSIAHLRERSQVMHCGAGGTTYRFLLAWAAVQEGEERLITGDATLLARPHEHLVRALCTLGADIDSLLNGHLVRGRRLSGGPVVLEDAISSQYLSALMLVAPYMADGLRITWRGRRLSRPYVEMTAAVMRHFGAEVEVGAERIVVAPATYRSRAFTVPRDWSAAAFWYLVAALDRKASIELPDLYRTGLQGDEHVAEIFSGWVATVTTESGTTIRHREGPVPRSFDLTDTPDLFQPLAFALAAMNEHVTITGLDNLSHKETDRIQAVRDAMSALGAEVTVEGHAFHLRKGIERGEPQAVLDPRGDHRMAMALAPLALVCGRIRIGDPDVVAKSYPDFWADLRRAGFGVGPS